MPQAPLWTLFENRLQSGTFVTCRSALPGTCHCQLPSNNFSWVVQCPINPHLWPCLGGLVICVLVQPFLFISWSVDLLILAAGWAVLKANKCFHAFSFYFRPSGFYPTSVASLVQWLSMTDLMKAFCISTWHQRLGVMQVSVSSYPIRCPCNINAICPQWVLCWRV